MDGLLFASDVCLFRQGMSSILGSDQRVNLAATACNEEELLSQISTHLPSVILLDVGMPRAFHACNAIRNLWPNTKVIALCVNESAHEIGKCAEIGFAGFVSREGSIEELITAVQSAERGEFVCSAKVSAILLQKINTLALTSDKNCSVEHLTPREFQVAELICEGLSNKQIADSLRITVSTTKNHVHHLLEKLGAHHRTEAAAIFRRFANS